MSDAEHMHYSRSDANDMQERENGCRIDVLVTSCALRRISGMAGFELRAATVVSQD